MIVIKASVRPSSVEGLGLFADEKIREGQTIWRFDPIIDLIFEPEIDYRTIDSADAKSSETYLYT